MLTVLFSSFALSGGTCQLPEPTLLALHIILQLHAKQLNEEICPRINISLLPSSSLQQSLSADNQQSAALDSSAKSQVPLALHWKQLNFTVNDPRAVICFRHCITLRQAMDGVPVRVVYTDSLIWFKQLGNLQQIKERMLAVLKEEAIKRKVPEPIIMPQTKWEEYVEDKPKVYDSLNKRMLKTQWITLTAEEIEAIGSKEVEQATGATKEKSTAATASAAKATGASAASSSVVSRQQKSASELQLEEDVEKYSKRATKEAKNAVTDICMKLFSDFEDGKYYVKGKPHAATMTQSPLCARVSVLI